MVLRVELQLSACQTRQAGREAQQTIGGRVGHHDRDAKVGRRRLEEVVDAQEHVVIEAVDDEQTLDQVWGCR